MTRSHFASMNCAVAHTLDVIGEWWTLLIIREAFYGARRFAQFQRNLGIARNILTVRLRKLVETGVLERVPVRPGAKRYEYRLTEMGLEVLPILVALMQWGDRWMLGTDKAPVRVIDRATGNEVPQVRLLAEDGRPLGPEDLSVVPGPGADRASRLRFRAAGRAAARAARAG
ncbi:MAG: helix-turn-helix domain-containing protein [Alphaproteobacteria bacterium]|nr:helix-turn-helix domain-containing protein [Alphaproteobacteria bacterium]